MKKEGPNLKGEYPKGLRPAMTPEDRESQLTSLAYDLVEKRLIEGTATSQETTLFLRRGMEKERERLELEILEKQKELYAAKTESIESSRRIEELYANAMEAMKSYGRQERKTDS